MGLRRTRARLLPRLARRMEERNADPTRLCEETGIDPIEMGALVACEREASAGEFEALANALACYPEDLFDPKVTVGLYTQSIRGNISLGYPGRRSS